jgi:hypothetical protein
VRKLVTWGLVTLGVAALVRRLRRRRESAPARQELDDPAAELRRKLDESRAAPEGQAPRPEASVEARRADVHGQGRAAIDEMRQSAGDSSA